MTGPADGQVEPCPWCGSREAEPIETVSYTEIFDSLASIWHVRVSDEVRREVQPAATTRLVGCRSCDLQYFLPLAPGNPRFYAELTDGMPYHASRWEFERVRIRIESDDALVDLGCGEGHFVRSLGRRPGRTAGVDHNIPAIDRLREAGVEALDQDISAFSERESGRFDVVTSFHLLEHVPDPRGVISAAARCLRPGGRLFVSVPNRERAFRAPMEPLDLPPHHVTRWSAAQFSVLPEPVPLELVGISYEPPDMSVVRELLRERVRHVLRWIPSAWMRDVSSRAAAKAAVGPVRHRRRAARGAYERGGMFGHSMLVELRRPDRVSA